MNVRLTKEETNKLNLSEKLILYYRSNPVAAAKDLLGVELVWFQRKTLRDLWFKKYNLLLMSRGIGKTWLQALFACLYAMLYPKVHIGVITPSFKQTEFLFDKINDFYEDSPFLRAAISKRTNTTYRAKVNFYNNSWIEGLPLGTGDKIRGRRYSVVLIDEYAFVDEDIVKKVVRPMLKVKRPGINNKYIISSTAYFTWNHFYLQYLLYIVMSHKKPHLYGLHEYIDDDLKMVSDPPFEMDAEIDEMMKMDTTEEMYMMENKCCTQNTSVVCKNYFKNISDIQIDDYVLSGSGKFEKITQIFKRAYIGEIISIKAKMNNYEQLEVTPDHRVFVKRGNEFQYIEAQNISISDKLAFKVPDVGLFAEHFYNWDKKSREIYKKTLHRADKENKYYIIDIESIRSFHYKGYVYNLEVDNDPSYVTAVCQIHNCQFPVENVGFFSARLIDKCTIRATENYPDSPIEVEGDPNSIYSMGIDAARVTGGDNFAISINKIDGTIKRLVHVLTLNGAPYQEMIYEIRRLLDLFNIVQINCDSGGGGTTLKDLLSQPYRTLYGEIKPAILDMDDKDMEHREGLHILRMVNFTKPVVNDLFMRLKADMQHIKLTFPIDLRHHSDKELLKVANEILETKRELLVIQAEGKGNYYQFDVPSQFKKDRATSLALAVQAANDFLNIDKNETVVELPVGFWAQV